MFRSSRCFLLLVLAFGLLPAGYADAGDEPANALPSTAVESQRPRGPLPGLPRPVVPLALPGETRRLRAEPSSLPAAADRALIEPAVCPADAEAWGVPVTCGYVPVPLDWAHPAKGGKIKIYFELYAPPHAGPAVSAILQNYGGPGGTTTGYRWLAFYFFGENLDDHDLLLIDDRGRGLSTAIDCEGVQHGTKPLAEAEAECAAQLGLAASRYGTGEVAHDTEAVRAALGYDKVDYFGWSYGGADVEAFATRFGVHLRSIVIDAPFGSPGLDPLWLNQARTKGDRRLVRLQCERSASCSADHPFPDAELALLADAIRKRPIEGEAYDAFGNLKQVRVDEVALLNFLVDNPSGNFVNTGEVLAAGAALRRGDEAPLLRLGAERHWELEGDYGDPTAFSNGAAYATSCVDVVQHWDWSVPPSERARQYQAAIDALRPWYFFPFSPSAVARGLYDFFGWQCLWWEKPTPSSPIAPRQPRYPHVPTLVLAGDIDQRVPLEVTSKVARLYPQATFVAVAEAGHPSLVWSTCAARLASEFIRTLSVGDASCASTPDVVWPAVGRFPRFARDARPADVDPAGDNQVGYAERKVARVAVAAATDAMQRVLVSLGTGGGKGLRGGTFTVDYGDWTTFTVTLAGYAFAEDVAVSGEVRWTPGNPAMLGAQGDGSFTATLSLTGPGTRGGALNVEGHWQAQGPAGAFKVTGTLGGRTVALLVPEA